MPIPYFLRLAYIGTRFHGWQIQTSLRSVQGDLWKALQKLDPIAPIPQGTGRTDSGVHARAQGVLIHTSREWEDYRLLAALNAHLPEDVRVMQARLAPEGFWPRQHAVAKRYAYRLSEGPAEDPFTRDTRWHVRGATPLNREAMTHAATHYLGCQDFASFRHHDCASETTIRTIHTVRFVDDGPRLDLIFEGDRFLMHQVRILAGTLVEVGKGRRTPEQVPGMLAARSRSAAGPTAPPHGLCMEEVWYQPRWGVGDPSPWPDTKERRES